MLQKTEVACSPLSSFILAFIVDQTAYGVESPLVSLVSCPSCVPSQVPAHPSAETVLMLCQHHPAAAKALGCYQNFSSYQCRAQHWEGCCTKMSSCSDPVHSTSVFSSHCTISGHQQHKSIRPLLASLILF